MGRAKRPLFQAFTKKTGFTGDIAEFYCAKRRKKRAATLGATRKIGSIISFDLPSDWDTAENKYVEVSETIKDYFDIDPKLVTESWPEQFNMWPRWQTASNFAAIDISSLNTFYTDSELSRVEKLLSGTDKFQLVDLASQLFGPWYRRDKATSVEEYFDVESQPEAFDNRRYYKITSLDQALLQGRQCAKVESEEVEGQLKKRTYHLIVDKDRVKDTSGSEGWNVQELHIMLWSTTENDDYLKNEFQQFLDSVSWR